MLNDIVEARPLEGYCLYLRFEDDTEGVVDVAQFIRFTGVFGPLRGRSYFKKVRVNHDLGTICWPNEADLDPVVLYSIVVGEPVIESAKG